MLSRILIEFVGFDKLIKGSPYRKSVSY